MSITTRLLAQQMPDSSYNGYLFSITRDIQAAKQIEDAYNVLHGRGVLPGSPAVVAVSGATVQLPAGFTLFSDGVLYTVPSATNFTPAQLSATVWLWGKVGVARPVVTPTAPAYSTQDSYSLTLLETVGAVPLPPDGYTTVTTGAASATQLVGTTSEMAPGDALYFVTAGVVRFVSSVTDGTHVVLTASVTTTNGEAVLEVGASAWMLLASWATDGSGNVTGSIDSNPSPPAGIPGKWLHPGNQLGWRTIGTAGAVGTHILSPAEARDSLLKFTGALTGNRAIEVPFEAGRFFLVRNATSGAFSLTLKINGGTGGAVPQGETRLAYVDGSDVVVLGAGDLGASVAGQFLTLATDADLTSERVFTPGGSLQGTDAGAGSTYTLDVKGNAGTPEGAVTAAVGALCRDTTNGDLYVKHTGSGNTGWVQLVPVSGATLAEAANLALGTGTGSKIGTSVSQKLGFWNAAPIVQPASANQATVTGPAVFNSTDGEIAALTFSATVLQAEGEALRDKTEELGDDCRALREVVNNQNTLLLALRTALVNAGIIKGAA